MRIALVRTALGAALAALLLTLAPVGIASAARGTPNAQPDAVAFGGGITSFYNDRCLDADLGSIGGNGTRIQLWDCGGDHWHNQNWNVA